MKVLILFDLISVLNGISTIIMGNLMPKPSSVTSISLSSTSAITPLELTQYVFAGQPIFVCTNSQENAAYVFLLIFPAGSRITCPSQLDGTIYQPLHSGRI